MKILDINQLYDRKIRQQLIDNPSSAKDLFGYEDNDATFMIKINTKCLIYIVFPDLTNLNNDQMKDIQAAGTASSAGTVSTAGCLGSTLSTAACAGSTGTLD